MHLLCRHPECIGHDLPAGDVDAEACAFCGAPLEDPCGRVLAREDAGDQTPDLRDLQVNVCEVGGKALLSTMAGGHLVTAQVLEGEDADRMVRLYGTSR